MEDIEKAIQRLVPELDLIPNVAAEMKWIEKFKSDKEYHQRVWQKIDRLGRIAVESAKCIIDPWAQTDQVFLLPFQTLPACIRRQTPFICLHLELDWALDSTVTSAYITDGATIRRLPGSYYLGQDWIKLKICQDHWNSSQEIGREGFKIVLDDTHDTLHKDKLGCILFDFFHWFGTFQLALRDIPCLPIPIQEIMESYAWCWETTAGKRQSTQPRFVPDRGQPGWRGRGNCFHPSTRLQLRDQPCPMDIAKVKPGDEIHMECCTKTTRVVQNTLVHGEFTFVQMFAANGQLLLAVTLDHVLLVVKKDPPADILILSAEKLFHLHKRDSDKWSLLSADLQSVDIAQIRLQQDTIKFHLTTSTSLVQVTPNLIVTTLCDPLAEEALLNGVTAKEV